MALERWRGGFFGQLHQQFASITNTIRNVKLRFLSGYANNGATTTENITDDTNNDDNVNGENGETNDQPTTIIGENRTKRKFDYDERMPTMMDPEDNPEAENDDNYTHTFEEAEAEEIITTKKKKTSNKIAKKDNDHHHHHFDCANKPYQPPSFDEIENRKQSVSKGSGVCVLAVRCDVDTCRRYLPNDAQLGEHQLSVHNIRKYRCIVSDCGQSFDEGDRMLDHLTHDHMPLASGGRPIPCGRRRCTASCKDLRSWLTHQARYHQLGHFACPRVGCRFQAKTRREIEKHSAGSVHVTIPYFGPLNFDDADDDDLRDESSSQLGTDEAAEIIDTEHTSDVQIEVVEYVPSN